MTRAGTRGAFAASGLALLALALGGWVRGEPHQGRPAVQDRQALTYFVGDGDARSGYQPSDHELAQWALEAWAAQSAGALRLQPSPEADALVRLSWAPPRGGVYGEMRPIMVNGREGAEVFVRADVDALDPDVAVRARQDPLWRDTIVYLTCLHELGHALGLSHTADMRDIMYYFGYGGDIVEYFGRYRRQLTSRPDIRSVSGLSHADVQRLRARHPVR
jgi:hypothetical protein